jgi:hypothetical protein
MSLLIVALVFIMIAIMSVHMVAFLVVQRALLEVKKGRTTTTS